MFSAIILGYDLVISAARREMGRESFSRGGFGKHGQTIHAKKTPDPFHVAALRFTTLG